MVAVGTRTSPRPPHRSRRALLTHRAPPSGQTSYDERCRSSSDAQPLFGSTRHFGSVSEPRPPNGCSPWVRPFPPRLPPGVASPCSVASQVLCSTSNSRFVPLAEVATSLDHLISTGEKVVRNGQAERFGG